MKSVTSLKLAILNFFNPPRPSDSWGDFYPRRKFTLSEFEQIKKIKVKGLGGTSGIAGIPNVFTVKLGKLELTQLNIKVVGPFRSTVHVMDSVESKSKTVKISYKVWVPGTYVFEIKYRGHLVPGSNFVTEVEEYWPDFRPILNSQAVFAVGKGLKETTCGEVAVFKLDTSAAGDGNLTVRFLDRDEQTNRVRVRDNSQLVQQVKTPKGWTIEYLMNQEGPYLVEVKYGGTNIPGSPFACHCYGQGSSNGQSSTTKWFKSCFKGNQPVEEERRVRWAGFPRDI